MRKSTKIAVVLAAAALLVAGFAFTTLAKGWVKEAEGLYYYEDADGKADSLFAESAGAPCHPDASNDGTAPRRTDRSFLAGHRF